MKDLSHQNVIRYFGMEVHMTMVYLFMEYCSEGSLAMLLRTGGGLGGGGSGDGGGGVDEEIVRVYAAQITAGLAYLHSRRVVHGDIKPDNILRDARGVLKLADFGSSELTHVRPPLSLSLCFSGTHTQRERETNTHTERERETHTNTHTRTMHIYTHTRSLSLSHSLTRARWMCLSLQASYVELLEGESVHEGSSTGGDEEDPSSALAAMSLHPSVHAPGGHSAHAHGPSGNASGSASMGSSPPLSPGLPSGPAMTRRSSVRRLAPRAGAAVGSSSGTAAAPRPKFAGTAHYMAPEVARGESFTLRSDVWSLGCTVWEMFTGRRPWVVRPDSDRVRACMRACVRACVRDSVCMCVNKGLGPW
jgi:serine/threonine protein kinase